MEIKIMKKIANFDHDINTFSGILNLRQQYENVQAVGTCKSPTVSGFKLST